MSSARLAIIPLTVIALIFGGCKKSEDSPASPDGVIPAAMVGTWTPTSASLNGTPMDPAQFLGYTQGAVTSKFTFNADGSYLYSELDAANKVLYTEAGTITVNGQNFTITSTTANGQPQNPPQAITGTYAVAGAQLTITIAVPQIGAAVVVMTK
jgi:VCBS repeat-containing protein